MDLRIYLRTVADEFDFKAPMDSNAQQMLRQADRHLGHLAPAGLVIRGSGGMGTPTFTPWVGIFDPDETTKPGQGLYVVYLFAKEMDSVTLMLLQGVTDLREKLSKEGRVSELRPLLLSASNEFRKELTKSSLKGWDTDVNLGSSGWRQKAYEAGNIVSRRYSLVDGLPSEDELRRDLWEITDLYQRACLARKPGTATGDVLVDPATPKLIDDLFVEFRPKDDSEYVTHLAGRTLKKKRRHETLIRDYGTALEKAGFTPATNVHPRDLMLKKDGSEWLVEAKVVYEGNATGAVREAVGQLLSYRHFLHPYPPFPKLVALFTEEVGDGYVGFLESLGIAVVWKGINGWEGSVSAIQDGLVVDEAE
jgi:hypothetical protein